MTKTRREMVHRLWDELVDFPASETDAGLRHLMATLGKMVGAGNAYWLGALRMNPVHQQDPLRGWRPCAIRYLHPAPVHDEAYRIQVRLWDKRQVDPSYLTAIRGAGSFRSYRMRQSMPRAWFSQPYYRLFQASRGFQDTCFAIFPLNQDVESYFAFHRMRTRRNFSRADEELLAYALRGLKWFHRLILLSYGVLLAEQPLSATQRRAATLLLTDKSEKEIATELGLSFSTTHKHVLEVFRRFGVRSRAGLTALWLGR